MTTITNANVASFTPSSAAQAALGAEFVLAAGVLGKMLNPLGAGNFAFAKMPSLWNVSAQAQAAPAPAASWTASTGSDGTANIDLGDGYTLALNENNSEIVIKNATTGENTKIWGDPHVEVDGNHAFDFYGTTTFTLGNGTKITINTEQYAQNPAAYVASNLTITKGSQSIVVDGISQNKLGDLSVTVGNNGYALDAATRDGFVLNENQAGAGWTSMLTGQVATQSDLDATKPGQAYGPGSEMPSVSELSSMLTSFLMFGSLAGGTDTDTTPSAAARSMATAGLETAGLMAAALMI